MNQLQDNLAITKNRLAVDETTTDIQPGQVGFNSAQKAMLAQLGLSDAPEGDLILFSHVCQKSGLDPFRKEIYMIGRNTQVTRYEKADPDDPNSNQRKVTRWETQYTIQTGIQGFRKRAREIADEKGDTLGFQGPFWAGEDGDWKDVWPQKDPLPAAAKYVVIRNGEPIPAVCHFDEYVQTVYTQGEGHKPNSMWSRMPRNQIAKCAEGQALQRAYPDELSGLLLDDAVHTIDPDGTDITPPPAAKRRGGKGVSGLAERAERNILTKGQQRNVVEVEADTVARGDGITDDAPAINRSLRRQVENAAKSGMRQALEKRLFALIGDIQPPVSRDDRILIYRAIVGRDDINSTDDLDDLQVTGIGDQLYAWRVDGELDTKLLDIFNAATLAEEQATQEEPQ